MPITFANYFQFSKPSEGGYHYNVHFLFEETEVDIYEVQRC